LLSAPTVLTFGSRPRCALLILSVSYVRLLAACLAHHHRLKAFHHSRGAGGHTPRLTRHRNRAARIHTQHNASPPSTSRATSAPFLHTPRCGAFSRAGRLTRCRGTWISGIHAHIAAKHAARQGETRRRRRAAHLRSHRALPFLLPPLPTCRTWFARLRTCDAFWRTADYICLPPRSSRAGLAHLAGWMDG